MLGVQQQQISLGSSPRVLIGKSSGCSRGSSSTTLGRRRDFPRVRASTCMDSPAVSWTLSRGSRSLYDVLGVGQNSDLKEIKSAYRHLARSTHPDVASVENKEESTKEFLKIHAAYTTLSDPESRARYDLQLSVQSLPRLSPRTGFSGYGYDFSAGNSSPFYSPSSSDAARASPRWKTSKSWETDQCW